MPFTETISITRTAVGSATHTSSNPPLPVASADGYVSIVWGDSAETITQNFKDSLQTGFAVSGFKGFMLFIPDDLLTSTSGYVYLSMKLFTQPDPEVPVEVILSINNGGASGTLGANEPLGRLYFLQPLTYDKLQMTFS